MDPVQRQYERYPYPPVPWLALPAPSAQSTSRFEHGAGRTHDGIRILVAGCGTLEALAVARLHPRAEELVALDLSAASLEVLRKRARLSRLSLRKAAPLKLVQADLLQWQPDGAFDCILASNVLHHVADPSALLTRLAGWLAPGGHLKLTTYPKQSRVFMRLVSGLLREAGLEAGQPQLARRAAAVIGRLPVTHPARSCFESQPERFTDAGLVDAFLHGRENPLSPLQWARACADAGLRLVRECQAESSRSGFLAELEPRAARLDEWTRLQILDDLLELCANPSFWLTRGSFNPPEPLPPVTAALASSAACPRSEEDLRAEISQGLMRAQVLLERAGAPLKDVLAALAREVGPRVSAPPESRALPGLSILDYVQP